MFDRVIQFFILLNCVTIAMERPGISPESGLFKGKFFYCAGQDTRNITSRSECLSAKYQWVRKTYHFDNLPRALLFLFVMFSKDSWVNIMYDGLDAVEVDKQEQKIKDEWLREEEDQTQVDCGVFLIQMISVIKLCSGLITNHSFESGVVEQETSKTYRAVVPEDQD
ncbi:Voltage-dependent T-type calcium channel subunit alpha-1H [Collichthys lucidus]|uniref:Voltage-dependent T-type calcium channel subunit alpha-1H n=1 Tax=Collichthys lucidus TaxID=240159 RepID=A0A4U5VGI9_COLLU|nr:Voltage-dependent T-type calcium channel subunit alpha-1H [Collichthys lucidus]